MRKIKFRAWDKSAEIMIGDAQVSSFAIASDTGDISAIPMYFGCSEEPEDFVIMQYTGLKDKNGKEIYEGDILSYKNWDSPDKKFIVKYGLSDVEGFYQTLGFYKENDLEENDWQHLDKIEVIGNIYKNPELLERGQHERNRD